MPRVNDHGRKLAKAAIARSNRSTDGLAGTVASNTNRIEDLETTSDETTEYLSAHKNHGVISGMSVSVNTDPRYFNISSGVYYINGVRTEFAGDIIDTVSIGSGEFASAIIDTSGVVTLLPNTFPTSTHLASNLELTAFSKTDANTINKIGSSFFLSIEFIKKVYLRHKLFEGAIFAGTAGVISENTTNAFQLDIDGGEVNTPNSDIKTITTTLNITGQEVYRTGGVYSIYPEATIVLDNLQYDNGDLTALSNNKYVVHTIAFSTRTDAVYVIYGTEEFNKIDDAINADYNLGVFTDVMGSEIEPLANVVIEKGAASVDYVIDLRNGTNSTTTSLASAFDSRLADLEARVDALEGA